MRTFREIALNENLIPFKQDILDAFKKSKFNLSSIPAIGSDVQLVIEFPNKAEADKVDIKSVSKVLNSIKGLNLKHIKDPENGLKYVQAVDWRKEGSDDPHEVYLTFK